MLSSLERGGWVLDAPWFTGTSLVFDRERGLSVIMLTNRVYPTRRGPNINPYRRRLANAVWEAITDDEIM